MDSDKAVIFTHNDPIWRSESNFIIVAKAGDDKEQLWVKQISENRFVVCCIPFFLYDIALGDTVETDADYCVTKRTRRSGRYVFRAMANNHEQVAILTKRLADFGALTEVSPPHLIAIDAQKMSRLG